MLLVDMKKVCESILSFLPARSFPAGQLKVLFLLSAPV